MQSLYILVQQLLDIYAWVIIIRVIFEWLIMFGIFDRHNPIVERVGQVLFAVTEPLFGFLRKYPGRWLPLRLGAVDLTPLVALLLIWFIGNLLTEYWLPLIGY